MRRPIARMLVPFALLVAAGVQAPASAASPPRAPAPRPQLAERAEPVRPVEHAQVDPTDVTPRQARVGLDDPVVPRMPMPPRPGSGSASHGTETPTAEQPAVPRAPGDARGPSPAPTASFQGLNDNGTAIPPDTDGTVGDDDVMTTLNTEVRITDRTGAQLARQSLDSFWSTLSNPSAFDPKIEYDPFNDRWIFACTANAQLGSSSMLLGASDTSDPTGAWHLYRFDADGTNTNWADFPSIGFNKNWVVVSANMFPKAGAGYAGGKLWIVDQADLYAGLATPTTSVVNTGTDAFTQAPAVTHDTTTNTEWLVEDWFGGTGELRVSSITGTGPSPEYNEGVSMPTSPQTWNDAGGIIGRQSDSTQKIDTGDSRIGTVHYRDGSLWFAQGIFLPTDSPTRAAAQWWQITPDTGAIVQRGRLDSGSSTGRFYTYPSLAVNADEDVLLGYTRMASDQFASANYAWHDHTDAPGALRSDTVLKAGEASYFKDFGAGENRWGDFSHTVVDPLDDTAMWTVQEYAETPVGGSDRWGVWWGEIEPPTAASGADVQVTKAASAGTVAVGTDFTYMLTVRNNGPDPATGVTVTDPLPAEVSLVDAGSCTGTTTLTCAVGGLADGAQQQFTVTVTAESAGTASNTATATSSSSDPTSANDADTATTSLTEGCTITGTDAGERLVGTSGDDVICGLGGVDTLVGMGGNDTLIGGAGFDYVAYDLDATGVTVDLATGTGTDGAGGTDSYEGIEGIVGSVWADTLTGDAKANEIYPLGGDDVAAGGGGFDYVRFDFSDAPVTVSLRDGVVAGEGADSVSGFEGVVATPFADRSTGNGVVNWLYGRGGNDKLYGLSGADRFYGGPGDDRMEGAGGNDDFFGGPGHDTCIQGRGHGIMKSC
jgi:uncharacterized repeat protein (TIGR01451 family)